MNDAVLEPVPMDQPDGAEHAQHRRVFGQRLGDQTLEARCSGDECEVLQQHGGDALVMVGVGDGERHLGLFAVRQRVKLADADDHAVRLDDERHVAVDVLDRGAFELGVGDGPPNAEEAEVRRRVAELSVERPQAIDVASVGGTDLDDPAGGQQHVAIERREEGRRREVVVAVADTLRLNRLRHVVPLPPILRATRRGTVFGDAVARNAVA